MRLRLRLAVLLVAAVVPFAFLLAFVQGLLLRRSAAVTTGEAIVARLDGPQLARCEASPVAWPNVDRGREGWRGRRGPLHRRPPRVRASFFVYDDGLTPARADAPTLPPRVRAALQGGQDIAWARVTERPEERLLVVARVAEGSPCAFVATLRPLDTPPLTATLVPALVVSAFTALLAVLAAGPLVRRVRRLTAAVRRARSGERVSIPIEGSDELTELARALADDREALAAKVEALRQRDEALTRFVSNTTHDVMIPLTVLQNHLLSIQKRAGAESTDGELSAQALSEAHYLGSLLQNLSAAAKLDAADRPLERVETDLADVVQRVAQRHQTLARQKGIALDFAVPERQLVSADLTLVERALSNLVHNAVRYGEPGGHVAIVLESIGEGFRVEVLDDGPGVAPDDLRRLGERRFRSEEARTRHAGGTGLGLAIAREVAERHGWRLCFEPNQPRGLRVALEG